MPNNNNIKAFEWIVDGLSCLKMESVNAHGSDVAEEKVLELEKGSLKVCFIDGDGEDMEFDDSSNTVILYDNSNYWVAFHKKSADIGTGAYMGMDADIDSASMDVDALVSLLVQSKENGGILNSKNYVGILDIGQLGFQIAVKSRKVNYDEDFNYLRESISGFCSDLLSRSSSYYSEHFHKTEEYVGEKVNYTEIAYLKEMMQPNLFPAWIDYLVYHAEHSYVPNIRQKEISEMEDVDSDFYLNGLMSGDVFPTNKIQGRAGKLNIAPRVIDSYEYEITYDTNENRFVKFFLNYVREYLAEMMAVAKPSNQKSSDKKQSNQKLVNELAKMHGMVDEKLEHPFWNYIADIQSIPFNSQILQKKYPYHLIFQMYTDFLMKSSISLGDMDKKYLAGQKDAPMLYQYWVFIMLFQYLSEKYRDRYVASDWISYDGKNLAFTLTEGRKSFAKFKVDEGTELILFYNKTYDSNHVIGAGRSYSHGLKPDISIEMFKNGELVAILHFDAKYRLPESGEDVPDDIDKMHTYKDGIMGTIGAFAICLSDKPVIYHEEESGWEKDGIFPAVGACPLNLNQETLEDEMNYICWLVDEFIKTDSGNTANRYSVQRAEKQDSLLRRLMKIRK